MLMAATWGWIWDTEQRAWVGEAPVEPPRGSQGSAKARVFQAEEKPEVCRELSELAVLEHKVGIGE